MDKKKKLLIISALIAFSSQIYIDFYISNFKFSFAGVVIPILLFLFDEINPILVGILSGISLYLFRILFFIFGGGMLGQAIISYLPESIFYFAYGVLFFISQKFICPISINQMFFISLVSDFSCNFLEVFIRIGSNVFTKDLEIIKALAIVAFIRAGAAWLILIFIKYYNMLLVKGEHEERYKRLLWLTSRLKTEVYWMEKNMDNIERVMSNAYELFLNITNDENKASWGNRALEISKDVHEIKKEYGLVVRGMEEILANRLDDNGMFFHELMMILKESMSTEVKYRKKNIELKFDLGDDFYTEKHYYLMSIFRNIVMNSIDSIAKKGKITFTHEIKEENHKFIIEDNGCGISGEDLSHIFTAGFSTKIDYVTGQVNRGLGLSLVKNIVEFHLKGDIHVHSIEGSGTTFIVSIPKKELEGTAATEYHNKS